MNNDQILVILAVILFLCVYIIYKQIKKNSSLKNIITSNEENYIQEIKNISFSNSIEQKTLNDKINDLRVLNARIKSNSFQLNIDNKKLKLKYDEINNILKEKHKLYLDVNNTNGDKKITSSYYADYKLSQFKISSKYLKEKSHPALIEAKRIDKLIEDTKKIISESRLVTYRNEELELVIKEKDNLYNLLKMNTNESVSKITSLYSDFLVVQYEISEKVLLTKKHPAFKEAKRIRELKEIVNFI